MSNHTTERDLMQGYWESYSKWSREAKETNVKGVSTSKAQMAVQGIDESSPIYQSTMNRLSEEYDMEIDSINAGQTKKSLDDYFERSKSAYELYLNVGGNYQGATEEGDSLRESIKQANTLPRDEFGEMGQVYQDLIGQRDNLIQQRNDMQMQDYYQMEFGESDKPTPVPQKPGQQEESPWW